MKVMPFSFDLADALLDDLRATKQHVLRQGSPSIPPNDNGTPTQSNFWSSDASYGKPSRNSMNMPRRPLQENLTKLDHMLHELEEGDTENGEYQTQGESALFLHSVITIDPT